MEPAASGEFGSGIFADQIFPATQLKGTLAIHLSSSSLIVLGLEVHRWLRGEQEEEEGLGGSMALPATPTSSRLWI